MIIGIDPGKTGGIICLDYNEIDIHPIPKIGTEVDLRELTSIFESLSVKGLQTETPVHVFIEQVHAIFGASAKSTFEFGRICGHLEGIVSALGLPYTLVAPKVWQKEMFAGIPEMRKPDSINNKGKKVKGRLDTKKMAELAYKRIKPELNLYITDKGNVSKNVHDGLVDALLIAEYGRRKLC